MKVGTVCYGCDQGLGRLGKSFWDAGVIDSVAVFRHPHGDRPSHMEWFPGAIELKRRPFTGPEVDTFVRGVDVMLFFETPFDWEILPYCRMRGVQTALIPMYEWTLEHPPYWFDKVISPSLLDADYFPGSEFIPIPADGKFWQPRTRARRYLHNGGWLGSRGHKGTLELLQAVQYLTSPLSLTIRSQDGAGLQRLVRQVPGVSDDPRVTIESCEIPYEKLWDDHDALVAPEKFNGLSLPLQEARAAGMLVISTDRYPMNTWLPNEPLIPVSEYRRAQTCRGHLPFDEAIVDPREIARVMDEWFDRDITEYSESGKAWAAENSWEVLKPRYLEALGAVHAI